MKGIFAGGGQIARNILLRSWDRANGFSQVGRILEVGSSNMELALKQRRMLKAVRSRRLHTICIAA